jgi:hypothetical protein
MNEQQLHIIAQKVAGLSHNVRTSGLVEFRKDSGPIRRDIRVKDFKWSSDALRDLAKILWAAQRAQSYAMAAYRVFSKMPSSEFSPDGLLGGRGYIQAIKDMRGNLAQTVEFLSSFTDTIHDEINADHWADAGNEGPEVSDIVEDAERVKANPDQFIEGQFPGEFSGEEETSEDETEEETDVENPSPEDMNPGVEEDEDDDDEEEEGEFDIPRTSSAKSSVQVEPNPSLPTDETEQKQGKTEPEMTMHTVSPDHGSYASAFDKMLGGHLSLIAQRVASRISGGPSSIDPNTLPGPRVEEVGPAAGGEFGYFGDERPSDDPAGFGFSHLDLIYEDEDTNGGVTGYDDPTTGDDTVLKVSVPYSLLPGADNTKSMNWYGLGISEEDLKWMDANSAPDISGTPVKKKNQANDLWGNFAK